MRIDAEPFDYDVPSWRPYDADRLAALAAAASATATATAATATATARATATATAALTGRGLPDDACEHFVRVPDRELEEATLPECGRAAFLGRVWDGFHNTYWLSLADGSVWMRYGLNDGPVHHMKQINTSVESFRAILAVYEAYMRAESDDPGEPTGARGPCLSGRGLRQSVAASVRARPSSPTRRAPGRRRSRSGSSAVRPRRATGSCTDATRSSPRRC